MCSLGKRGAAPQAARPFGAKVPNAALRDGFRVLPRKAMRREITYCAVGLAAGLVVVIAVSLRTGGTQPPAAVPVQERAGVSDTSPLRAANEGIGVPGAAARSAGDLIGDAVAAFPRMTVDERDGAVRELVAKLRAHGPIGLQALLAFFKTGDDVKLRGGWGMTGGKITSAPSLRIALLEALSDWPGALEVNRAIARMTSRPFEAVIAIRNLERIEPGVHRAEAIRTVRELAEQPVGGDYAMEGAHYVIEAMRHFKATELLPAAEKIVERQPDAAYALVDALTDLPAAVRGPAIARTFSHPVVARRFASNPYVLRNLPFSEPVVVAQAARLFSNGMTVAQQEGLLAEFGQGRDYEPKLEFFAKEEAAQPGARKGTDAAADIKGRLDFLARVEPAVVEPEIMERVDDAREELTKGIEDAAQDDADGKGDQAITIGDGIGDALIKGRKIKDIKLRVEK